MIAGFYEEIRRGESTGACEYCMRNEDGEEYWERMEFANIFDTNGKPIRAVIAVENITDAKIRDAENKRLKDSDRILQIITQHTDRTITYFDLKTHTIRFRDEDTKDFRMSAYAIDSFFENILPESLEKAERMFQDIYDGASGGEEKLLVKDESGKFRWLDMKYSTIFDENHIPITALLSYQDVTEQYEHELAYLRYSRSLESESEKALIFIESDLTLDITEKMGGSMLPPEFYEENVPFSEFSKNILSKIVSGSELQKAMDYFSVETLLECYKNEKHNLKSEWNIKFRDGSMHWLDIETILISDPYNAHIKAFFRIQDITDKKASQLEMQQRSERDGMTGLFNRATAEERIKHKILDKENPGVLALLDLDDLKGINDTFGHEEGDRAIKGIAGILKEHFRETDIIGRIGGDEFIVYLPGAAGNKEAIAASMVALLRKLAGISIGKKDERRIHCSIGCTVQISETDIFEILFKQVDTALYHVKRNGKNNIAFYTSDMDSENYIFQSQKLYTLQSAKKFELDELPYLLDAISDFYPLMLSVNLSNNDYYLMEVPEDKMFSKIATFGELDAWVNKVARSVHSEDKEAFSACLSRKALMEAYGNGEKSVRHYFRFINKSSHLWTEATVFFYTNKQGDVCDFTLLRWADEKADELEHLWMHKVMELAVASSFEYICLINLDNGEYYLYGGEQEGCYIPRKGDFMLATRNIMNQYIAPGEREKYFGEANIKNVCAKMEAEEEYSYYYNMPDGIRKASFHWFEPTHHRLLMTVQRC
ncbi:MAG: diguanylate cyclase [Firmicutes bacterium]|nr:diguanylate cyclase [Bacillota bacterium]